MPPGGPSDGAQESHPRRQIRSRPGPRLRHRLSGAGAHVPDAEGARSPRRPQHRGLHHRLSRLAARRTRLPVPARRERAQAERHRLSGRPERGSGRHRAVGLAAGRTARRGQVRWRVRHLVRQGAGRRPLRRRAASCQFRRHVEAWRRARADGRRPHGRILDHRASVRIQLRRRDDPDPQPGRRAGNHRLRPLRLGDVALLRHLGRPQMHARDGGIDRRHRRSPRADRYRHADGLRDARGRAQHPPARHHPRHGGAPARLQARRHAGVRTRQQAQPRDHVGRAQAPDRRHHDRQELSRRAPGARRARHRRGQVQRLRPAHAQDRLSVADQPARACGVRAAGSSSSSWSRRSAR